MKLSASWAMEHSEQSIRQERKTRERRHEVDRSSRDEYAELGRIARHQETKEEVRKLEGVFNG